MQHFPKKLLLAVLVAILLTGCARLVTADQMARPESLELVAGNSLGQTFQARFAGLQTVAVYLQPGNPGDGQIRLHLRRSPTDTEYLAVSSLPLSELDSAGFYHFHFSTIPTSSKQDYYFFLENEGSGSALVGFAALGAYPSGSLYQNHQAVGGQLSFRIGYDRLQAAKGLAREGLDWTGYLAAAFFSFVLPGWALLAWLWRGWDGLRWPEQLGIATGASLAIYPLLFLWTSLAGLHLGRFYAWLPPALGLIALLYRNWKSRRGPRSLTQRSILIGWLQSSNFLSDLVLLVLMAFVFAVRFWGIRLLEVPMWGDSYQHTLIAQLLVDHGGLFQSWSPYAELQSFTYHFGLHSLLAVFHWLTGQTVEISTLWAGQILNGLAVISLYPLAKRLGRSPWAGVAAVLIAGLLAPMPMYYVNWGRYTQLAGQVILPASVWLVWEVVESWQATNLEDKKIVWKRMGVAGILLAGLALTHYRVFLFALTFFAALLLFYWKQGIRPFVRLAWIGIGAGILVFPWMWHVFGSEIYQWLTTRVTTPATQLSDYAQQSNAAGNLFAYLPAWLWLALPIALGLGLWRREKDAAITGVWWFLTYLAANPQWLGLPGTGVISSFTVLIAAYIPAALLVSTPVGWIDEAIRCGAVPEYRPLVGWHYEPQRPGFLKWVPLAFLTTFLALGAWGMTNRLDDVQIDQHSLATHPDLRAAQWIQANTPAESRFLVNSFFAYNNGAIVGSDGGWWLPLIARRSTTLPPLNYTVEKGPRPGYIHWVNQLTATINTLGIDHPDTLRELAARGVTHVYIGQKQGAVNNPGLTLNLQQLLDSPHYRPVYHQDGVWIFQVQYGP